MKKFLSLLLSILFLCGLTSANEIKIPEFETKEKVFFCITDSSSEFMMAINENEMIMYYQAKGERSASYEEKEDKYTATYDDFKIIFFKRTNVFARTWNSGSQGYARCTRLN